MIASVLKESNRHSFGGKAATNGFSYQTSYALYYLLNELDKSKSDGRIKDLSIRQEGLDNIELSENVKVYKIVQTKACKKMEVMFRMR
ncbi:MAG: hypothetical protein RL368_1011 [Pseudomonadota bacterium]|jgi:hypothetical protein